MRRRSLFACFALAAIGAASATPVLAGGYWNMPGTLSQRIGHGYSGGYHAPFLLGPIRCDGWGAPNEVRLRCSPAPICGCASGCGCYRVMDAPSTMEGDVPMAPAPPAPNGARRTPAPAVAPVADAEDVVSAPPAVVRPLFDAPVQQ